jgi:hypothetical protein
MSAFGIAYEERTQRMRRDVGLDENPREQAFDTNFNLLLEAHRAAWDNRKVQCLPSLCFPFPETNDGKGMRYALWHPVTRLLELSFPIEIEEWMCNGEVALVYLERDTGRLIEGIYPEIEEARRGNPYYGAQSALQLTAHALLRVRDDLEMQQSGTAGVVDEMRTRFVRYIRTDSRSLDPRWALAEAARTTPRWAASACLTFLNSVSGVTGQDSADLGLQSLALASESSLGRDWLRPEEEAAWSYLREAK